MERFDLVRKDEIHKKHQKVQWGSNSQSQTYDDSIDTASCEEESKMDFSQDDFCNLSNFSDDSDENSVITNEEFHIIVDRKQLHDEDTSSSLNPLTNVFKPKLRLDSINRLLFKKLSNIR